MSDTLKESWSRLHQLKDDHEKAKEIYLWLFEYEITNSWLSILPFYDFNVWYFGRKVKRKLNRMSVFRKQKAKLSPKANSLT